MEKYEVSKFAVLLAEEKSLEHVRGKLNTSGKGHRSYIEAYKEPRETVKLAYHRISNVFGLVEEFYGNFIEITDNKKVIPNNLHFSVIELFNNLNTWPHSKAEEVGKWKFTKVSLILFHHLIELTETDQVVLSFLEKRRPVRVLPELMEFLKEEEEKKKKRETEEKKAAEKIGANGVNGSQEAGGQENGDRQKTKDMRLELRHSRSANGNKNGRDSKRLHSSPFTPSTSGSNTKRHWDNNDIGDNFYV